MRAHMGLLQLSKEIISSEPNVIMSFPSDKFHDSQFLLDTAAGLCSVCSVQNIDVSNKYCRLSMFQGSLD